MIKKKTFLELFDDSSPYLSVKFSNTPEEKSKKVFVTNNLCTSIDKKGKKVLENMCKDIRLDVFFEFYSVHDGLDFCIPVFPETYFKKPLLKLIPSSDILNFNKQYTKGGKWAWIIDLNKSKDIYRGSDSWIAFAEIAGGPTCLTIFLTGENTGCVYLVMPQPRFNILKPIAKSFDLLLARIAKDPAAFFRLVGAYVTKKGEDGQNYGLVPVEYVSNSNL